VKARGQLVNFSTIRLVVVVASSTFPPSLSDKTINTDTALSRCTWWNGRNRPSAHDELQLVLQNGPDTPQGDFPLPPILGSLSPTTTIPSYPLPLSPSGIQHAYPGPRPLPSSNPPLLLAKWPFLLDWFGMASGVLLILSQALPAPSTGSASDIQPSTALSIDLPMVESQHT